MDKLIEQLKVLSNPQRLIILRELTHKDYYISELSKKIKMSQPLTQIYLKQLEVADLVKSKLLIDKKNQVFKRIYTINDINIIINQKTLQKLAIKEV
jgi:predicted transcriptional regulator